MASTDINVKHMHSRINRRVMDEIKRRHPAEYQFLYEGWLIEVRNDTDYTSRKRPSDRARSRTFVDLKEMYYDECVEIRAQVTREEKEKIGYVDQRTAANHSRRTHGEQVGETQAKRRKRNDRARVDEAGVWTGLSDAALTFRLTYNEVTVGGGVPRADNYHMLAALHELRKSLAYTIAQVNYVHGRYRDAE